MNFNCKTSKKYRKDLNLATIQFGFLSIDGCKGKRFNRNEDIYLKINEELPETYSHQGVLILLSGSTTLLRICYFDFCIRCYFLLPDQIHTVDISIA